MTKKDQLKKNGSIRQKHNRDKLYTDWLHGIPCMICDILPVETHHVDGRKFGTNDHRQIPLCLEHHRGTPGIHNVGNISFQINNDVDIYEESDNYYKKYKE